MRFLSFFYIRNLSNLKWVCSTFKIKHIKQNQKLEKTKNNLPNESWANFSFLLESTFLKFRILVNIWTFKELGSSHCFFNENIKCWYFPILYNCAQGTSNNLQMHKIRKKYQIEPPYILYIVQGPKNVYIFNKFLVKSLIYLRYLLNTNKKKLLPRSSTKN